MPLLAAALRRIKLLDTRQYAFIQFARSNAVEYGDAARGLPLPAESVDVLYSSHMLEHLDRGEALSFLGEVRRVLCRGGTLRLSVPDLRRHVSRYIESGNADAFIEATELTHPRPKTFARRVKSWFVGPRNHQWMYDGESLTLLLSSAAFVDIRVLEAGQTTIERPEALDLHERSDESVYVEAKKV